MRVLIVEGVNGVGKTTLANRLGGDLEQQGLSWIVAKAQVPSENPFAYFQNLLQWPSNPDVVILDRWAWSNMVYAGREGGAVMSGAEFQALQRETEVVNARVLLLVDDPDAIAARLRAERNVQDPQTELRKRLGELQEMFFQIARTTMLDVDTMTLRDLIDEAGAPTAACAKLLGWLEGEADDAPKRD